MRTWQDPAGDRICCEIKGQGIGIAAKDLPQIYEPFFTTQAESSGVGLGLSVVYGIIREHNGEITVGSEEGKGTTFRITLPVAPHAGAWEKNNG